MSKPHKWIPSEDNSTIGNAKPAACYARPWSAGVPQQAKCAMVSPHLFCLAHQTRSNAEGLSHSTAQSFVRHRKHGCAQTDCEGCGWLYCMVAVQDAGVQIKVPCDTVCSMCRQRGLLSCCGHCCSSYGAFVLQVKHALMMMRLSGSLLLYNETWEDCAVLLYIITAAQQSQLQD